MAEEEYECSVCGLHYRDREDAKKCYAWCSEHGSCNLELTKSSVERREWLENRHRR
jgi:hypothetical protein